jgi:MinD superfamily P-loop ATPase
MNSLDRMLTVLSHFNIPTSIVMNRFDLNRDYADKVEDLIRAKWAVSVAQRIPSDENVPISLSKRTPVVEYAPNCEASKRLVALSDRIKDMI